MSFAGRIGQAVRGAALMDFAGTHTAFVAGALAIAALAAVLAGVVGSGFRAPPRWLMRNQRP